MKRSLICIGFATLATAAAADTSVTISGDLKVSGVYGNNGTTPIDGAGPGKHWALDDDSSFFAISGKQDLANGLWAGFDLASFVNVDSGATSDPFFARHAVVQFGGNFGQVYLGRALTPSQLTVLLSDPWYWDGSIAQAGWLIQQANYTSTSYIRTTNTFGYVSPTVGGFTLSLADSAGENVHSADLGGSLTYSDGGLSLAIAYDQSHTINNDPTLDHTIVFTGGYDFKFVHPQVSYTSSKVLGANYNAYTVGFSAPAGAGGTLKGMWGHLDDADTVTVGKQSYNKFSVGYQYAFNKSVSLFGDVSSAKQASLTSTNNADLGIEYGF